MSLTGYVTVTEDDYLAFVKWAGIQLKRDVILFADPPVETFTDDGWKFPTLFVARAGLWDEGHAEFAGTVPKKVGGWWREWCHVREDWWKQYQERKD